MILLRNIENIFFKPAGRGLRVRYAKRLAINAARFVVFFPIVAPLFILNFPFALCDMYGQRILDAVITALRLPLHACGYFATQRWARRDYREIQEMYRANKKALAE